MRLEGNMRRRAKLYRSEEESPLFASTDKIGAIPREEHQNGEYTMFSLFKLSPGSVRVIHQEVCGLRATRRVRVKTFECCRLLFSRCVLDVWRDYLRLQSRAIDDRLGQKAYRGVGCYVLRVKMMKKSLEHRS